MIFRSSAGGRLEKWARGNEAGKWRVAGGGDCQWDTWLSMAVELRQKGRIAWQRRFLRLPWLVEFFTRHLWQIVLLPPPLLGGKSSVLTLSRESEFCHIS